MSTWIIAAACGFAAAVLSYASRGVAPGRVALAAPLRALAVTLIAALALDATVGARRPVRPLAALNASVSWTRARDDSAWRNAVRSVRAIAGDSVFLVGDSIRIAPPPERPTDLASRVRPAVERALAVGRPLQLFTDGEIDDADALDALPVGSSVSLMSGRAASDAALTDLSAPRALVAGDTVELRVAVGAGGSGSAAGRVVLQLGDTRVTTLPLEALPPFGERQLSARIRVPPEAGARVLRAIVESPGDREARNDTLGVAVEVSPAAGAVLVSTSPDYDARDALGILRGTLALPTRGYYRIAPGMWRTDGTLSAVSEDEVRRAVRDAPLAVLHGDTAIFGPPRALGRGGLALLAPPQDRSGEWYVVAAPPSPMSAALTGVEWDSLPPLDVGVVSPGDWQGLEVRRARRFEQRPVVVGSERPHRTIVVGGSGFWRWRFRGGRAADAFAALWGSIFDWLSQERTDVRAALPADGVLRAGEPVRWRRGGGADSLVPVTLSRRGAPVRTDSMMLRFAGRATVVETAPLTAGTYDARVKGGAAILVVNASRELLPRRPSAHAGPVGRAPSIADPPRLRSAGWVFVLIVLALCVEWLLRRRIGMR